MKKKTSIICSLLAVGIMGSSAVGVILSTADDEPSITVNNLQKSYALNEEFTVPDAISMLDGKQYPTEYILTYPDGRESAYATAILDMYGEYHLQYSFTANGETYSETHVFTVEAGNYASLFTNLQGCTITENVSANSWCDFDFNGVGISFDSTGGSFAYNGVIDLSNKKKTDTFIELIANPSDDLKESTDAMRCFTSLTFILTDINDPNNYLEIVASDDDVLTTRVTTSACGRYTCYGMLVNSEGVLVSNSRGPQIYSSLAGKPPTMNTGSNSFGLSYTSDTKTLWGLAKPERSNGTLILDYDDPSMVESQYLWEGFSTDQVYLTVKGKTRASKVASIVVTSINGQSLSGSGNAISETIVINTDTFGYQKNALPKGSVGMEYPVFEATAYDNYGILAGDVNTIVRAPNGNALPIVDGKFKTETAGRYSITYTAKNAYASGKETLYVEVENFYSKPTYTVSDLIPETVSTGDKVVLFDGEATGGVGKLTLDLAVSLNGTNIPVQDYGKGRYFIADKSGEYVLCYTVTDQIGNKQTYEYTVTAEDSATPVMAEPSISKVNIVGREVKLPRTKAVLYKGKEILDAKVRVYYDETEITETMAYTPATAGMHTLRYVAEGAIAGADKVYEYTVEAKAPATDSKEPFVSNFLALDGFVGSYTDKAYRLTAIEGRTEAYAQFFSAIPQEIFEFEIAIETKKGNFEEACVYLTDSEKASERVALSLSRVTWEGKERVALYINGAFVARVEGSFGGENITSFLFKYDWKNKALLNRTNTRLATIESTETGEEFTGFSSGRIYFSLAAKGIEGETQIKLTKVAGQSFSNATTDKIAPALVGVADEIAQNKEAYEGETYTLANLQAFDVLDNAYCDVFVTIRTPNSTVPVYSGPWIKDYEVKLTQAGTYTVTYSAKDAAQNEVSQPCYIIVKEFTLPVISVTGMPTEVEAGKTVALPLPTVADNVSALNQMTTYIYVVNEDGERETVLNNEHIFKEAGKYTVRFVVIDNSGNRAVAEFVVTAK